MNRKRKPWTGDPPARVRLFYGLARIAGTDGRLGRAARDYAGIGPAILDGVAEWMTLERRPGTYAVLAWIPENQRPIPDWGVLIVRGPGSWVLRSADGLVIAPAPSGPVMLSVS